MVEGLWLLLLALVIGILQVNGHIKGRSPITLRDLGLKANLPTGWTACLVFSAVGLLMLNM